MLIHDTKHEFTLPTPTHIAFIQEPDLGFDPKMKGDACSGNSSVGIDPGLEMPLSVSFAGPVGMVWLQTRQLLYK